MPKKLIVTKAAGEQEVFSESKLRTSMRESGAPRKLIDEIIYKIKHDARPGLSTSEIHRRALQSLKAHNRTYAARYNLKKGIMNLGPDGYPFEKYFAALLEHQGFAVSTNVIVQGNCITHEVDIIAEKHEENIHAIIEAKFHSHPGRKTGAKDALYTYARFLDIKAGWEAARSRGAKPRNAKLQCWLVTNTEMTIDAKKYCDCNGIKVIAWSHPNKTESLQGLVHHAGLYPITALTSLNDKQKKSLLRKGAVMCKDVVGNGKVIARAGVGQRQQKEVLAEAENLCGLDQE